jgi:hypothetical protein
LIGSLGFALRSNLTTNGPGLKKGSFIPYNRRVKPN